MTLRERASWLVRMFRGLREASGPTDTPGSMNPWVSDRPWGWDRGRVALSHLQSTAVLSKPPMEGQEAD